MSDKTELDKTNLSQLRKSNQGMGNDPNGPGPSRQSRRMVSDFTLSSQRENIAGLEVVLAPTLACGLGRRKNHGLKSARLEGLAAAESGLDVMPPFELIAFIGLPTEQHDAAVAHRRKID